MPKSGERGFTLIELMMVVVIIGILAMIAIPKFIAMQQRAKEGSTKSNMHTFQLAADEWAVNHDGRSPNSEADLKSFFKGIQAAERRNPYSGDTTWSYIGPVVVITGQGERGPILVDTVWNVIVGAQKSIEGAIEIEFSSRRRYKIVGFKAYGDTIRDFKSQKALILKNES